MAANQYILKSSVNTATVKVAGIGSTTILLSSLASSNEQVVGTPIVNILSIAWTGSVGSSFSITRSGVEIVSGPCDQPYELNFAGSGFTDTVENTGDMEVTIVGANAQLYIIMRKASGFELV